MRKVSNNNGQEVSSLFNHGELVGVTLVSSSLRLRPLSA